MKCFDNLDQDAAALCQDPALTMEFYSRDEVFVRVTCEQEQGKSVFKLRNKGPNGTFYEYATIISDTRLEMALTRVLLGLYLQGVHRTAARRLVKEAVTA